MLVSLTLEVLNTPVYVSQVVHQFENVAVPGALPHAPGIGSTNR